MAVIVVLVVEDPVVVGDGGTLVVDEVAGTRVVGGGSEDSSVAQEATRTRTTITTLSVSPHRCHNIARPYLHRESVGTAMYPISIGTHHMLLKSRPWHQHAPSLKNLQKINWISRSK